MTLLKSIGSALLASLFTSTVFAYIPEGQWRDGHNYFYVNNKYQYCSTTPNSQARHLTFSQREELRSYSYEGNCDGYDKGGKNYRGVSYYFNGEGAYCQYAWYKSGLQEMSSQQANNLFQSNAFHGTCVE